MFLQNNHFCLKWKSEGVSFNQAIKELKDIVDNYITEENVSSRFKYEFIPKKIDSHLTNFIVYDLETHNTDRARPNCILFSRLSKLASRYNRDITPYEYDKCKNDSLVFVGDDCITRALDFCLKFKREKRKTTIKKVVENNLQLHAHNGSGFDKWIMLNNIPCDKHIADIIKNGKSFISMKVFIAFFEKIYKQKPQYLIFRCGMTQLKCSLKKSGRTFKLQKKLLKTGMKHD